MSGGYAPSEKELAARAIPADLLPAQAPSRVSSQAEEARAADLQGRPASSLDAALEKPRLHRDEVGSDRARLHQRLGGGEVRGVVAAV